MVDIALRSGQGAAEKAILAPTANAD